MQEENNFHFVMIQPSECLSVAQRVLALWCLLPRGKLTAIHGKSTNSNCWTRKLPRNLPSSPL